MSVRYIPSKYHMQIYKKLLQKQKLGNQARNREQRKRLQAIVFAQRRHQKKSKLDHGIG